MQTKTVQIEIPQYLTIRQYLDLKQLPDTDSKIEKTLFIISTITGIDIDELRYWDLESIKKLNDLIEGLVDPKNEFHSIIEWNGVLYGYDNIKQQNLGEYIDLEGLAKEVDKNLHKIAAILYRPITDHRFDTIDFIVKHKLKTIKHKDVANVFDYYNIEKYDSNVRKVREKDFMDFPVQIALGALSFFLTSGSQYLTSTVYSLAPKEMIQEMNNLLLENLIHNTGAGGGLFTHSLKPIYYQLQGTNA